MFPLHSHCTGFMITSSHTISTLLRTSAHGSTTTRHQWSRDSPESLSPRHACWQTTHGFLMLPQLLQPPGMPSPWHSAQAQTPGSQDNGARVNWLPGMLSQRLSLVDSMFWDVSTNGQALRLMIYKGLVVQCSNQLSAHFSETYRYAAINENLFDHSLANTGHNKTIRGCQDKHTWCTKEPTTEWMPTKISCSWLHMYVYVYMCIFLHLYIHKYVQCTHMYVYIYINDATFRYIYNMYHIM